MTLKQIFTCLLAYTVLATIADAQQIHNNNDAQVEHRAGPEEDFFPYYGGLRGHYYNKRDKDIIRLAADDVPHASVAEDFNHLQTAATKLVEIQEQAKEKGAFSREDNERYANSLYELGKAAQKLAQLQQSGQIKDFSQLLQNEIKLSQSTVLPNPEDDLLPSNNEDPYEDIDSVAINLPKKDSAVAEAKPEGLSIAGVGGVASSKPNAIALSGVNGLAVASPKATAIAGVSAEEAASYSIGFPSRNHLIIKKGQKNETNIDHDHVNLEDGKAARINENRSVLPNDTFVQKWKQLLANTQASNSKTN